MKNAKNVHFLLVDHRVEKLSKKPGFVVLSSPEAFERFSFTRDYFEKKPKEGYFIWIKKSLDHPLVTCISISSMNVSQVLQNLIIIEKNVKAEINSACNVTKKNLRGKHRGYSEVMMKGNSELKIKHFHSWGEKDTVSSDIKFFLEKGAKLSYAYKCLRIPGRLKTKTNTFLKPYSSANFETVVLAKKGSVGLNDTTYLNGEESRAISRIRMVGDRESKIVAKSAMIANDAGTGHLDCMGLLLDKNSSIQAIPELINRNKNASLTHEASVGKISEEILNYLRTRGLSKDEAIDLVVAGFLGEEEPIVIKGRTVKSELYM